MKIYNIIKYSFWVCLVFVFVILVWLCNVQRIEIKELNRERENQQKMIETLSEMSAVHCEVTVNIRNTATFGKVVAGDVEVIADQIARATRKEILDSCVWLK